LFLYFIMKKSLLAFALLASAATAFAHDGDKPTKGKKDNCTGMAATKCEKGMASGNMAGMPACCRAKMAAAKAATPATATANTKAPVVKAM
jgi:hypothetical protein